MIKLRIIISRSSQWYRKTANLLANKNNTTTSQYLLNKEVKVGKVIATQKEEIKTMEMKP